MLGAFTEMGITRNSSIEDIKAAYKILVKKHHPDAGGRREDFVTITRTYDRLMAERAEEIKPKERSRFSPRVNIQGWGLNEDGNGIIGLDFDNMAWAETQGNLFGYYHWPLWDIREGCFEIKKKHLIKCNYKVEITFTTLGMLSFTKEYQFPDSRGWFTKLIHSIIY